MDHTKRKQQAKVLRGARKLHRITGIFLFVFFFIIAVTGLLLGWKKQTGLLPPTTKGTSANATEWLSIDSLKTRANTYLHSSVNDHLSTELDRIDIRPNKGIVKFVYATHFWELQLDCATGSLLQIGRRNSDIIEKIHDGSLLDYGIKTSGDWVKLIYNTIMGFALILFTVTGFWLWYGPKRMKKAK
jgi:uncharacterized iron-regulated membrane protein